MHVAGQCDERCRSLPPLLLAPEPQAGSHPQRRMFRLACVHASPPEAEAARQEFRAHQGDHVLLLQPVLVGDGLEGRAVFPRHLDDAVLVLGAEGRLRWGALGFALFLLLQEAGEGAQAAVFAGGVVGGHGAAHFRCAREERSGLALVRGRGVALDAARGSQAP